MRGKVLLPSCKSASPSSTAVDPVRHHTLATTPMALHSPWTDRLKAKEGDRFGVHALQVPAAGVDVVVVDAASTIRSEIQTLRGACSRAAPVKRSSQPAGEAARPSGRGHVA